MSPALDVDSLVRQAIFGSAEEAEWARGVIRGAAREAGLGPASIQGLYEARGRGEISGFTVPAFNLRILPYQHARRIFRAAKRLNAGALIFELSRGEMGYSHQTPEEYGIQILAAALREGYGLPVFLQGDHYQVSAKSFAKDPATEIRNLEGLIERSLAAGFYNIDIDASTLVDLSRKSLADQQRPNIESTARLIRFVRQLEIEGHPAALGGEIGEVGEKNSTPEELRAFMDGLKGRLAGVPGLSKISIQTGTTHGGVPLPEGGLAQVKIDFDALADLSRISRKDYGLAGAVQHGASTLPESLFGKFPETETAEIHLATAFTNIFFDHPSLPATLKDRMEIWCDIEQERGKQPGETQAQFLYKNRKKALGPFKHAIWNLEPSVVEPIMDAVEIQADMFLVPLKTANTGSLLRKYVKPPQKDLAWLAPSSYGGAVEIADTAD